MVEIPLTQSATTEDLVRRRTELRLRLDAARDQCQPVRPNATKTGWPVGTALLVLDAADDLIAIDQDVRAAQAEDARLATKHHRGRLAYPAAGAVALAGAVVLTLALTGVLPGWRWLAGAGLLVAAGLLAGTQALTQQGVDRLLVSCCAGSAALGSVGATGWPTPGLMIGVLLAVGAAALPLVEFVEEPAKGPDELGGERA